MGFKTPRSHTVPVIDFSSSELNPGRPEWELTKLQVREAAEKYGCFTAKIDRERLELDEFSVFGSMQQFFDLPLETKNLIACEEYYRGYVGQVPDMPLFERIGIDDPTNFDKVESFTNVLWPQGNLSFSKKIEHTSKQLSRIDKFIRRILVESCGAGDSAEDHLNSTDYILRVVKYEDPEKTDEKMLGLIPHTDKGMMAILYQNQVHGFQLQTKDGQWIDVKPSPGSLIVVIGESYNVWSNGRFRAPYHRVMSNGKEKRYAIMLVTYPRLGYLLKAHERLVDEDHPPVYRPLEFSEMLKDHKTPVWKKKEFGHCHPAAS